MPSSVCRSSSRSRSFSRSSSRSSSSSSSDEERIILKHDEFEDYRRFAQWYLRSDRAFIDYTRSWSMGFQEKVGTQFVLIASYLLFNNSRFAEKHAAELDAFFAMKDRISSFDELLKNKAFLDDFDRKHGLAKLMNDAAGSARGNDIKGLLDKGLVQARGHHHVVFSRLLCPVRLLKEFDKNHDEYRRKILRGDVKFNDQDFPSMLYPYRCNRDLGQKPKKRSGQAKINRMTEVTPGSIAYSYLMFWYNISSISDWRTDDDLTDRSELYDMVLGMFDEHEEDDAFTIQWRKDMLDWWNFQVFGIVPDNSEAESEDESNTTTLKLLHAQRAQKAAAAAALAAAATQTIESPSGTDAATRSSPESSSSSPLDSSPVESHSELSDPPCSAPPSPPDSSSSPPVEKPQTATPPRSSPAPGVSATPTRQPLSPAHRMNVEREAHSPVRRPAKFTRQGHPSSAVSKVSQSRR
ncbi:hypothetical protein CPB84DRAFT_1759022 [Gymnopilus junonius]|uniref:Uncharacterized protein n=2 Tax=Gymnopilus junonius TaxID=109634 RepID=A0A9P5P0A0_GYMJU|nr:hypothetical protein CPB84DRAFT_1759022 [Gymnopilus junonius]